MVHPLDPRDFRAGRLILEPEDFALGDNEPDSPPTDLISEDTWNGVMTLPGDVAIRTTSHQGTRVAILYELWSGWVHAMPHTGIVAEAMMDSADDFASALFNLMHGFYKQSLSALRSALETMTLACACETTGDGGKWSAWQGGEEIRFKLACDTLQSSSSFRILEDKAQEATGLSIYAGDNGSGRNAWARNLFRRLSKFAHSRGDSSNFHFWNSNGPIYSAAGMRIAYHSYLETYSLLLLIAKVAAVNLKMPAEARLIYKADSSKQYLPSQFEPVCLFYWSQLFP